jgi:hypothetical protein
MIYRSLGAMLVLLCVEVVSAQSLGLPEPGTLDGLGVNIHFTDPRPGEMKMLADAGFNGFAWISPGAGSSDRRASTIFRPTTD